MNSIEKTCCERKTFKEKGKIDGNVKLSYTRRDHTKAKIRKKEKTEKARKKNSLI